MSFVAVTVQVDYTNNHCAALGNIRLQDRISAPQGDFGVSRAGRGVSLCPQSKLLNDPRATERGHICTGKGSTYYSKGGAPTHEKRPKSIGPTHSCLVLCAMYNGCYVQTLYLIGRVLAQTGEPGRAKARKVVDSLRREIVMC